MTKTYQNTSNIDITQLHLQTSKIGIEGIEDVGIMEIVKTATRGATITQNLHKTGIEVGVALQLLPVPVCHAL